MTENVPCLFAVPGVRGHCDIDRAPGSAFCAAHRTEGERLLREEVCCVHGCEVARYEGSVACRVHVCHSLDCLSLGTKHDGYAPICEAHWADCAWWDDLPTSVVSGYPAGLLAASLGPLPR